MSIARFGVTVSRLFGRRRRGGQVVAVADQSVLASKINLLFDVMHKRGEPAVSTDTAAAAISARSGVPMSAVDLARLRSGDKIDATEDELRAIASFFGVAERYLLTAGPVPEIDASLSRLRALRDAGVRRSGGDS